MTRNEKIRDRHENSIFTLQIGENHHKFGKIQRQATEDQDENLHHPRTDRKIRRHEEEREAHDLFEILNMDFKTLKMQHSVIN